MTGPIYRNHPRTVITNKIANEINNMLAKLNSEQSREQIDIFTFLYKFKFCHKMPLTDLLSIAHDV